jgi:hypothetical protein
LSSLRIAHLDNSSEWVDTGVLFSNTGASSDFGTITSSNIISFDGAKSNTCGPEEFTLASTTTEKNPLPIELLSFTAKCDEDAVKVEWTTLSEINNDYFTIEKSLDAVNFFPIENVNGAGNSNKKIDYKIIDDNPYEGINYYRLFQTDFNGEEKYYSIVPVNFKKSIYSGEAKISVWPNPFKDEEISVNVKGFNTELDVYVGLYDLTGNIIWEKRMKPISSEITNSLKPIISMLNRGIFFLIVSDNENIKSTKIIKL